MKVNTPFVQGLKAVYKSDTLESSRIKCFLHEILDNFTSMSVGDTASRTDMLNMWGAFLEKEVTDYFGISPIERKYDDDILVPLQDPSQKLVIKEWQRSQESGIEIYSENDGRARYYLGDITIGYDGFCPFKKKLYEITQKGNLITIKWRPNSSSKDWIKKTFNLTHIQEEIDIKTVSKDIVNRVLSYLNEVSLSTDLKVTKKSYYKSICEKFSYEKKKGDEKDNGDNGTLYEHLFQLRDLFNNRSTKGEAGTDYIIYRGISIILQHYAFPRNLNAVLNYEELFAVCSLYKHRLHELENDANHNFEGSDINIELFKEVLNMYVSYCSKAHGHFSDKGTKFFDNKYASQEDSMMNHLKPTVALLSTYYFLSNPEKLKAFCSGLDIHVADSLTTTEVIPSCLSPDQQVFYQKLFSSIQPSGFSFRLFPKVAETIKTNRNQKGICEEIDKQLEKSDINYDLIRKRIEYIINQSEGITVPVSTKILRDARNHRVHCESYVFTVIKDLQVAILANGQNNLFCKTFIERDNVEAIRKYILLNVQLNEDRYTIQNNLTAVYHHIANTLTENIDRWDYQKGDPPTAKDLLHELSSLASYLLKHAIASGEDSNAREAARLWRWEDIPEEMQTNKDTFIKLGIIRNSQEKEGMYEFENQCYRLVLAALGQKCDNSQDALEHINSFLRFYSAIAVDGTKNHLEYHMDDASIYITMFLLSLTEEKRDALITEMCTIAKNSISPGERVKQEAYIFCLSLLLVQSQYQPSSRIRKKIFELYECNIYHDQILSFNDLKYQDPYYTEYPRFIFSKSLLIDKEDEKTYPPYYIYLLATTMPKLIGERKSERSIKFNAEEIVKEGADKIFDSFLRLQYLTWMSSNSQIVTICENDLLPLLTKSKEILVNSLESTPNEDTMKITYGLQALFMALSNVERIAPRRTQWWDKETKQVLFECLIFSEYFQRKYNRFYNYKDMSDGKFWLQCGGLRYIASLNIDVSIDKKPIVSPDRETANIIYPVFANALELEKSTNNWRFYYMLVRLLGCSNCFDYYAEMGKPIDIPKLDPLCKMDDIFMRYDNMAQWMESQHYV